MKAVFSIILLAILVSINVNAQQQRISYVDTEYILEQMPEYRSAQKQLDDAAEGWKKETEKRQADIDKLFKNYQAEWVLLPEETRKKREEDIAVKEKALADYRKEKFGPDGELFKKRQTLIKPIQDKVYKAVEDVVKENQVDFMFDKAGAVTMLYSNAKYDRSDEVLEKLGIGKNTPDTKTPNKIPDDKKVNPVDHLLKKEETDKKGNPINNILKTPEKK
ncbi:MAG: OmpH family outer membrane protein [Bacteroidetes bacterium]|nr:OmpH family outer membrane protein [Bacteroidota bacterium]